MAHNPHMLLPPSKRYKILNSEPMQVMQQHLLPAKKRFENVTNFPTAAAGSSLPTKKRTQVLNRSPTSAFLPFKKRTTVCTLPAKKRVWVPVPVSPDKPESQPRDLVPVKKRAWARFLSSPTKTRVSDTDTKSADVGIKMKGIEESNQLPAKKRVWIDLNTVQEINQIDDGEEVSDVSAPNPVSAIQEVTDMSAPNPVPAIQEGTVEEGVQTVHPLTPALLGLPLPHEGANPEPLQQKDSTDNTKVKEINGGKKRVLAPNPLSSTQSLPALRISEEVEKPMNLKPLQENQEVKPKEVKKQVLAQNPSSGKKKVRKDLESDKENRGVTTKKRVWALNPSSVTKLQDQAKSNVKFANEKGDFKLVGKVVQDMPARKKLRVPLSPIAEENDQTVSEGNEIGMVLVKKRVWAPEPLVPTKTDDFEIKQCTNPEASKLRTEKEFEIKGGDNISGVSVELLSPFKTETQNEDKASECVEEEDDDGVVCAVCQSTDGEPSDPIVFCDGCDLMVHASCYGNPLIKSIPEGDWFCSVCSSKSPKKEKRCCCLCPSRGGALKPTVDGKWAHVMCALLVPEVFFLDPEGRDGIDCSRVPDKRWQKDCFVCGRNNGCAIDCAESKCKLGFHVSCGLEEGLCIEYREGKESDIVAGFCTEHTKLWKKQQLTGKFRIVSSDQDTKKKTD